MTHGQNGGSSGSVGNRSVTLSEKERDSFCRGIPAIRPSHSPLNRLSGFDELIRQSTPQNNPSRPYPLLREVNTTFPGSVKEFETFLDTSHWKKVRQAGLLLSTQKSPRARAQIAGNARLSFFVHGETLSPQVRRMCL